VQPDQQRSTELTSLPQIKTHHEEEKHKQAITMSDAQQQNQRFKLENLFSVKGRGMLFLSSA
jgi:hypothetical protein